MKRKFFTAIPAAVIVLAAAIAGIVFSINRAGFTGGVVPEELQTVEVREYEGKNLSSVNDFRENSSVRTPSRAHSMLISPHMNLKSTDSWKNR